MSFSVKIHENLHNCFLYIFMEEFAVKLREVRMCEQLPANSILTKHTMLLICVFFSLNENCAILKSLCLVARNESDM